MYINPAWEDNLQTSNNMRIGNVSNGSGVKTSFENDVRASVRTLKKAKNHNQRMIIVFYCVVLLAAGLTLMLYCSGYHVDELQLVYVGFFTVLFVTSILGMLYVLFFVITKRTACFEIAERSVEKPNRILFSLRGEAVNLYLRIGLVLFALMALAFDICRAMQISLQYRDITLSIVCAVFRVAFFIAQTIFLLTLHRLVLLSNVIRFSFILLHVATVNLCVWIDSVISEVLGKVENPSTYLTNSTLSSDALEYAVSYILPAVPEYSIIAAAMLFDLARRIGQLKQIQARTETASKQPDADCKRRPYGVLLGFVIIVIVLALVLFLIIDKQLSQYYHSLIHLSELLVIHLTCTALIFVAIVRTRQLKFSVNFAEHGLDQKLLMVTLFLSIGYFFGAIVMSSYYLRNVTVDMGTYRLLILQLTVTCLEVIEVLLQVYLIFDMFYRCCQNEIYQRLKPGRDAIAVLASLNFSLWLIDSFQLKKNCVLFQTVLGALTTPMLNPLHTFIIGTLPMAMLFRYHSSVCFAICYRQIYEDEVSRYESMLRWVDQDGWNNVSILKLLQLEGVSIGEDSPVAGELLSKGSEQKVADGPPDCRIKSNNAKRRDTQSAIQLAMDRIALKDKLYHTATKNVDGSCFDDEDKN